MLIMDLMFQTDCTIERPKGSQDAAYRTIISTEALEVNIFFTNRVPDAYKATCPWYVRYLIAQNSGRALKWCSEKILFKLFDAIPSCECENGLVRGMWLIFVMVIFVLGWSSS